MNMDQERTSPKPRQGKVSLTGPRWKNLAVQVMAIIFLPLTILVLVVAFGSTRLHQTAMRTLVGERDERAARAAANSINSQLLQRADLMRSLAIRGSEENSLGNVLDSSAYLDTEFDFGLAFLTPSGELIASRGNIAQLDAIIENSPFQQDEDTLGKDAQVKFSKPIPSPNSDNFLVIIYASSGPDNPIAVGAFSIASIAHLPLASAFMAGEGATTIVVDRDQRVVYSIGDSTGELVNGDHPGISEVLAGESGADYYQVNGSENVTAYSPVHEVSWGVVIEEPWESVSNPILNTTLLAPLAFVPVLILSMIALWFGARRIVQPLQSLEDKAAKLAWGDFQAIEEPVAGIDEINRLQHTLIHMAHKLKIAQQGLRGYINAITTGQEEERRRLARELHDDTIQSLIALKQRVQLTGQSNANPSEGEQLQEIQLMADQAIHNLRRITRDLRPLYLEDLGLVATLEMLVKETSNTCGIPIDFQSQGDEQRYPPGVELTLYRITQEALNNITRHAEASHASVGIIFKPNTTTLRVSDDGCGFVVPESPAEFAPSGHFGLLGMHERAELIGADLEIRSATNQGTELIIKLDSPEGGSDIE